MGRPHAFTFTTNPDDEAMPVAVPKVRVVYYDPATQEPYPDQQTAPQTAPQFNETYVTYVTRLQDEGLLGRVVYNGTNANTQPKNAVTGTPLQAGTITRTDTWPDGSERMWVAQGTEVDVQTNTQTAQFPETAQGGGGGGGTILGPAGCSDVTIRGFNLGPLNVPVEDVFPFAIVTYVVGFLSNFSGAGNAPNFDINMPGGVSDIHIDFSKAQPTVDVLRPVFLALATAGFVWLLVSLTLGVGSRGGDD